MENVPVGSRLIIRLEDTSVADASGIVIKEVEFSNLLTFPLNYRIRVPATNSSEMGYSLSAHIQKGDMLLYINEEYIPVTLNTAGLIKKDIPVVVVRRGKYFYFDEYEKYIQIISNSSNNYTIV